MRPPEVVFIRNERHARIFALAIGKQFARIHRVVWHPDRRQYQIIYYPEPAEAWVDYSRLVELQQQMRDEVTRRERLAEQAEDAPTEAQWAEQNRRFNDLLMRGAQP